MSERWYGGFLNGDNPVIAKAPSGDDLNNAFSTREEAADSAEARTPGRAILVARFSGGSKPDAILEAKRGNEGGWTFTEWPDLARVFGH